MLPAVRDHGSNRRSPWSIPPTCAWIFLTDDDHYDLGNLEAVLERCPAATLVAYFAIAGRLAADVELPFDRMRWLDVGESLNVGDCVLTAVRPLMFDFLLLVVVRLLDRVLWAADAFGALVPGEVYEAADVPRDLYEPTFDVLNSWNTPWLEWVDAERFAADVHATVGRPCPSRPSRAWTGRSTVDRRSAMPSTAPSRLAGSPGWCPNARFGAARRAAR